MLFAQRTDTAPPMKRTSPVVIIFADRMNITPPTKAVTNLLDAAEELESLSRTTTDIQALYFPWLLSIEELYFELEWRGGFSWFFSQPTKLKHLLPMLKSWTNVPTSNPLENLVDKAEELMWNLKITSNAVKNLVDEAEELQLTNRDVKEWLDDLKNVIYHVEYLLNEIDYEAWQSKRISRSIRMSRARRLVLNCLFFKGPRFEGELRRKFFSLLLTEQVFREFDRKHRVPVLEIMNNTARQECGHLIIFHFGRSDRMGKTTLCLLIDKDDKMHKRFDQNPWDCLWDLDVIRPTKRILHELDVQGLRRSLHGCMFRKTWPTLGMRTNTALQQRGHLTPFYYAGTGGMAKTTLCQLVDKDDKMHKGFDQNEWLAVTKGLDVIRHTESILHELDVQRRRRHLDGCMFRKNLPTLDRRTSTALSGFVIANAKARLLEYQTTPMSSSTAGGGGHFPLIRTGSSINTRLVLTISVAVGFYLQLFGYEYMQGNPVPTAAIFRGSPPSMFYAFVACIVFAFTGSFNALALQNIPKLDKLRRLYSLFSVLFLASAFLILLSGGVLQMAYYNRDLASLSSIWIMGGRNALFQLRP